MTYVQKETMELLVLKQLLHAVLQSNWQQMASSTKHTR